MQHNVRTLKIKRKVKENCHVYSKLDVYLLFKAPSNQCTMHSFLTSTIRIILSLACTTTFRSLLCRNIWLMIVSLKSGNLIVFKCFQALSALFQRNISPCASEENKMLPAKLKQSEVTYPVWPSNSSIRKYSFLALFAGLAHILTILS